ncbi:MAG: DUF559 domain-containing protein [Pseudomonadota bacterium]
MPVDENETAIEPSPSWGGLGGGASSASADDARQRVYSAADAAGPPPTSPTRGEEGKAGFRRLRLPPNATARARSLRRSMTPAERLLWRGLRETFPEHHWRKQVPFGRYITDFCSHGAKLIIEVDGGQHSPSTDLTRFLECEGYRLIRLWNNDVTGNLDGVIGRIAMNLMEKAQ